MIDDEAFVQNSVIAAQTAHELYGVQGSAQSPWWGPEGDLQGSAGFSMQNIFWISGAPNFVYFNTFSLKKDTANKLILIPSTQPLKQILNPVSVKA